MDFDELRLMDFSIVVSDRAPWCTVFGDCHNLTWLLEASCTFGIRLRSSLMGQVSRLNVTFPSAERRMAPPEGKVACSYFECSLLACDTDVHSPRA